VITTTVISTGNTSRYIVNGKVVAWGRWHWFVGDHELDGLFMTYEDDFLVDVNNNASLCGVYDTDEEAYEAVRHAAIVAYCRPEIIK